MPIKEINLFHQHGRQFVPDLRTASLPAIFRGRPLLDASILPEEAVQVKQLCPTGAFGTGDAPGTVGDTGCYIDLGACVFCRECEFALPDKIRFTNDHRLATNTRAGLIVRQGEDRRIILDESRIRKEIRMLFRNALKLRQVSAAGDNATEMELNAAGNVNFDMGRYGIEFVASPRHADGIVITGPVSANMAAALQICYDATPEPRIIILSGTDAISGGIFAGSPALHREFTETYPADLYVPGNPPHPLTFINGILDLLGKP